MFHYDHLRASQLRAEELILNAKTFPRRLRTQPSTEFIFCGFFPLDRRFAETEKEKEIELQVKVTAQLSIFVLLHAQRREKCLC
jgi:hypothetical protein